jgi:Lar family restriction alleviation protein
MEMTDDLRPCPFCAHDEPKIVVAPRDKLETICIMCPECGATGPSSVNSSASHATMLWNQRYGRQSDH